MYLYVIYVSIDVTCICYSSYSLHIGLLVECGSHKHNLYVFTTHKYSSVSALGSMLCCDSNPIGLFMRILIPNKPFVLYFRLVSTKKRNTIEQKHRFFLCSLAAGAYIAISHASCLLSVCSSISFFI
jgi:hypothetical protein